jgi:4-amino-4-deoxy-L-arabinose transferase-like glycosyltransferase
VFGAHNWSYKLPSLLAAIGGVWAVYRFTLLFYNQQNGPSGSFHTGLLAGFAPDLQ